MIYRLILTIFILLSTACDTTDNSTDSKHRTSTQYSHTLDQARQTADQMEQSLSTTADRLQDAKE